MNSSLVRSCCYVGISQPTMARNAVLLSGLERHNIRVLSCVVGEKGYLRKYASLIKKLPGLSRSCDFVLVAYLSNMLVPVVRMISRKPVVYNALNAMFEGAVLDRVSTSVWSVRRYLIWVMDFVAFHAAHLILVESHAQQEFLQRVFLLRPSKVVRVWTGADDRVFCPDPRVRKQDTFTVLFRSWFVPGTGVEYVLEAARLLLGSRIKFLIIGRGPLHSYVKEKIHEHNLSNVELVTSFLSEDDLRRRMLSCHVMLGAFADHPRLERTIQNKTFEALALGMPYVTRDSKSNRELLVPDTHALFVNAADAGDLAAKILLLKENTALREKLGKHARALFVEKLLPEIIAAEVLRAISLRVGRR